MVNTLNLSCLRQAGPASSINFATHVKSTGRSSVPCQKLWIDQTFLQNIVPFHGPNQNSHLPITRYFGLMGPTLAVDRLAGPSYLRFDRQNPLRSSHLTVEKMSRNLSVNCRRCHLRRIVAIHFGSHPRPHYWNRSCRQTTWLSLIFFYASSF